VRRKGIIDQLLPGRKVAAREKTVKFAKGNLQKERETDWVPRNCKTSEISGRE